MHCSIRVIRIVSLAQDLSGAAVMFFCVFLLSAALGGRLLDVFDVWQQHPIRADRIVRFVFGDGKRGLG